MIWLLLKLRLPAITILGGMTTIAYGIWLIDRAWGFILGGFLLVLTGFFNVWGQNSQARRDAG